MRFPTGHRMTRRRSSPSYSPRRTSPQRVTAGSRPRRSDTGTGERHMRHSAGRRGGLDLVVLLDALQPVPEADASAEQDRDHHRVHVVDEPGSEEVADHGGTSADAYVLAVG